MVRPRAYNNALMSCKVYSDRFLWPESGRQETENRNRKARIKEGWTNTHMTHVAVQRSVGSQQVEPPPASPTYLQLLILVPAPVNVCVGVALLLLQPKETDGPFS